jgi:formylglycine-generating enzyme required for sulfatase activity
MGKFEVTQGQWRRMGGTFSRELNKGQGDDIPAYWISYLDAEEYCRKLNELAHSSGELPKNWEFRLPTEAQWEYACRAETTTAYPFGNTVTDAQVNFGHRSGESAKVGSYPANAWGIHDMLGNVWELCRDWYHWGLPGGTDPEMTVKGAPNRDGTYSKVRRGSAWIENECRVAFRLRYEPNRGSDHIGARIAVVRV